MRADFYLKHGNEFPYDANDAGARARQARVWATKAARGVLADLTDRRGIKWGFNDIDHETRKQIIDSIASIIRLAAKEASE